MEIRFLVGIITVNEVKTELTQRLARNFPVLHFSHRFDLAVTDKDLPVPLCKVWAKTVDKDFSGWLLLVEDPVEGLVWEHPVLDNDRYMRNRYLPFDDLEAIPTVVLR